MPRGITSKGLATRRRIVEGAAAVVRERGVAATGLEDVRAATGTSGGQLAHYFPGGKGELMLAVTAFEADQILLEQQPLLGDLTSWEAWKTWAAELLERHVQQGEHCGLSVLIGQLDPNDPAVQRIILGMYREWGPHSPAVFGRCSPPAT
ncbi:TetR/AcrR family transcriptional regulator [Streptomyces galilaeus]